MYILERSKIKEDRRNGRWLEVDVRNLNIATILTNYAEVYFFISYPIANGHNLKGLLLSKIRGMLLSFDNNKTFQQWLDFIGDLTLPFEDKLLEDKASFVRYAQAWHAGYKAEPVNKDLNSDKYIPDSLRTDLLLTNDTKDIRDFTKKALVTVNGFFHPCGRHEKGVLVYGGGTNIYNSNDNQIGIYSFETVGDIKTVLIDDSWLSKVRPDAPLYDGTYITIPESYDITNKTVLLVIGGYLNVLNDVYYEVTKNTFRVNFTKMMLLDRIFQSFKEMNLERLDLFPEKNSPTLTMMDKLKDDEVIRKYVTATNSFFVLVDSPGFFQEYKPLEYLRLPGRSLDLNYEQLPLVGAYGKMMDYHVIKEHALNNDYHEKDRVNVYCATINIRNRYDNNRRPWHHNHAINAGRNSYYPFVHENYHYRLLGVEK